MDSATAGVELKASSAQVSNGATMRCNAGKGAFTPRQEIGFHGEGFQG